jgi:Leucine-rich repeat (LRR) protein
LTPYAIALGSMRHSLRELTLRNNAFVEIPLEVLELTELTSFSMAKNQLSRIDIAVFPHLTHLTWLSLSYNQLESLPDDLASCRHLQGLDLSNNKFHGKASTNKKRKDIKRSTLFRSIALPPVISQLHQLQILLFQKNHLSDLPIHSFPSSLQTLNLAFNQFRTVPLVLVSHPPPALTHLHLSGNPLSVLPNDFLQHGYKNLVSLDLHTCGLTRVPPALFTHQTPLRRLNLAINHLEEIPATIGCVTPLQWLNLNDNRLVTLPSSLAHLVHLVKLGLVQNCLRTLPCHLFSQMTRLEKIDLRRNQLVYLPPSILALAPEEEMHQHVDLAVPIAVFHPGKTHPLETSLRPNGGGSLKTLLLYENSYLEQKDGLFCCSLDTDDDQEEEEEEEKEEGEISIHLIGLEKLSSLSNSDSATDLAQALQTTKEWLSDPHLFFYPPRSLKNLALSHYLSSCPWKPPRCEFLSKAFPALVPSLLHDHVVQMARPCDHCGKWTTTLPFQVGYLARLCNNRMQVPIRTSLCSPKCALNVVIRIQQTTAHWRQEDPPPRKSVEQNERFITRVFNRVTTSLVHCVSSPPPLSPHDPVRLTDPRPALTSFHHMPRDAIRLERF